MRTTFQNFLFLVAALLPSAAFAATTENPFDHLDSSAKNFFFSRGVLEVNDVGETIPSVTISRADFVRAIVDYTSPPESINGFCLEDIDSQMRPGVDFSLLFADVSKDAPYALHLCKAMRMGMIWGYADGTFRPYQTINFVEAAKVLNHAFGWDYAMPEYSTTPWYESYVATLHKHTTVPKSVGSLTHAMTAMETRSLLEQIGHARSAMLRGETMESAGIRPLSTLGAQTVVLRRSAAVK